MRTKLLLVICAASLAALALGGWSWGYGESLIGNFGW
jgi:hypothetical protein